MITQLKQNLFCILFYAIEAIKIVKVSKKDRLKYCGINKSVI